LKKGDERGKEGGKRTEGAMSMLAVGREDVRGRERNGEGREGEKVDTGPQAAAQGLREGGR